MTRWPLLALCTACPETGREGGRIDRAMAKDVQDELRSRRQPPACQLFDEEWAELCDHAEGSSPSSECPAECIR
ncbi:MAG: hypothetical protein ABW123_24140 [Cystobacter sp.]